MNLKTYKTEDKVFIEILEPITMNDVTFTIETGLTVTAKKAECTFVIEFKPEVKTILDSLKIKFMAAYGLEQTKFYHSTFETVRQSKSVVTAVKNKQKALALCVGNANLKKDITLQNILKDINSRLNSMVESFNMNFEQLYVDIYTGRRTNFEKVKEVIDTAEIDVAIDNLTKQKNEIDEKLKQVEILKHDKLNMGMLKLINEQGITCDNDQPIPVIVKTKICEVLAQNKGFKCFTRDYRFNF